MTLSRPTLALSLAAALLLFACGRPSPTPTPATRTAEGVITAVEAASLIEWTSVTLREPSGRELTFLRGNGIDLRFWRASHLREHIAFSDLVRVTYRETPQGLVAESISHATT